MSHGPACGHSHDSGSPSHPLVSLENVAVDLDGAPILKGITAQVAHGKITALFGLNGSGKTTLLRAILKEIPYRGKIVFTCGHDHRQPAPQHVGYVPQRLRLDTNFPFTVRDFLAVSLSRRPLFLGISKAMEERFGRMMARVGAPASILGRPMDRISGGEQQRVLLALALEPDPELLLLDEPAAGIDFKDQKGFYDLIREINERQHITVLLVSHETDVIHQHVDHVLCLKDGRLACEGAPESVLTTGSLEQVFGVGSSIYRHHHQS
jgi:zinc transport system ATP-binding protein